MTDVMLNISYERFSVSTIVSKRWYATRFNVIQLITPYQLSRRKCITFLK